MSGLTHGPGRSAGAGLLVELLGDPRRAAALSLPQWDAVLRVARAEKLLSRLGAVLETRQEILDACPGELRPMFRAARAYPELVQSRAAWEVRKILSATADLGIELVLLKGAAYAHAGLPLARARVFADLDLLVREDELAATEACLLARGWEHHTTNAYDQRYYREWMHEIPPLRHRDRQIEVDIHHRILPRIGRLTPSPGPLWDASIPVGPRLRVLAPADMVLHCAVHLFHDGEIRGGFRDLLDLHQLLLHFDSLDTSFWGVLVERARLMGLARPLYYAVRFCREILRTPVPDTVSRTLANDAPGPVAAALMGRLVHRVLPPRDIGRPGAPASAWLLYVRSHWLRMPPGILVPHLLRKALRRLPRPSALRSGVGDDR
jgi:hypothetical protein